jgi:hypothetical protein
MAVSRIDEAGLNINQYGNRNIIINGGMKVAQRGTQTNQAGGYTACDRWQFVENGNSVVTTSQDTDVPSGHGFANSLKIDVTTASGTPSSTNYALLRTKFEGQDVQHLRYGTSSAKQLTLSFWVKSSKTGTHYAELVHSDAGYYNSIAYTVSSANTWENKVITFNGYQTTAFDDDNNNSFQVYFWLMTGSDYGGGTHTANTWHNTEANRVVGQVNVMDSTSNNFYLTGVQMEVGTEATPFEHRSFGDELARCQRYFQIIAGGVGIGASSTSIETSFTRKEMRAAPSGAATGTVKFEDPTVANYTQSSGSVSITTASARSEKCQFNNFSGLTSTRSYFMKSDSGLLALDAEL